jgi:hypothetical protein
MAAAALCSSPALRHAKASFTTRRPSGMRVMPVVRAQLCSNGALQRRKPSYAVMSRSFPAFGGMSQVSSRPCPT